VAGLLLTVGLHKMLGISCAAMQLLACEEVLSSKQLNVHGTDKGGGGTEK
jgi:hypothetical protein